MFENPDREVRLVRAECHPFYWVSSEGRVFRERKDGSLKPLIARPNNRGYLRVDMGSAGVRFVHRVVLEAFVGECPPRHETCHWDGNPRNNRLDNLRWGTVEDQLADKVRHGTIRHKYRDDVVEAVRNLLNRGLAPKAIAQDLGVEPRFVYHLRHNTRRRRPLDRLNPDVR